MFKLDVHVVMAVSSQAILACVNLTQTNKDAAAQVKIKLAIVVVLTVPAE